MNYMKPRLSLLPAALITAICPVALGCGSSPGSGTGVSGSGTGDPGSTSPGQTDGGGSGPGEGGDAGPVPVVTHYVAGVTVSTLAGSSVSGNQDGNGAAARFANPTGIALDAKGNLVVTDYDDGRVRLVTPAADVTTIAAGTGFSDSFCAVVATDGKYYVQTDANSSGVKDAMTGTIWLVTPLSGGGIAMPTVVAQNFGRPRGMAAMAGGNLFVVDRTQELAETLDVSTGQTTVLAGTAKMSGYVDGTGGSARFNGPVGAAPMPDGSFVVTDAGNNVVRRVTAGGVVSTLAGNGAPGLVDGPCASASFNAARGVAVDTVGNVYVSDIGNHVIRRINTQCNVETVAGDGKAGFKDGAGNTAEFYGQEGIAVTPNGGTIYVADGNAGDGSAFHRVRAITIAPSAN
jgi:sugar lactone lactonase YvrE